MRSPAGPSLQGPLPLLAWQAPDCLQIRPHCARPDDWVFPTSHRDPASRRFDQLPLSPHCGARLALERRLEPLSPASQPRSCFSRFRTMDSSHCTRRTTWIPQPTPQPRMLCIPYNRNDSSNVSWSLVRQVVDLAPASIRPGHVFHPRRARVLPSLKQG